VDGRLLRLEITESLLQEDINDTIRKMDRLRGIGVQFALDDFGTGYSSLSYLRRLPLHSVKIDRAFVDGVVTDPNDAAIAQTILALAKTLGLQVVAEGVEDRGQFDFLLQNGCDAYQGFLFSKPLAPNRLAAFPVTLVENAFGDNALTDPQIGMHYG
jgi:EAL domain-containing protein (putative c-di-GMP-specific phosphodiesterase class I)